MAFIDAFRAKVGAIQPAFVKLQQRASAPSAGSEDADRAALAPLLKTLRDAVAEAVQLLPVAGKSSLDFADFFHQIGQSVVDAQGLLDASSAEYLAKRPAHASPSVFKIPKVSASMKFELGTVKDEKINLVFYSTSTEAREAHQQSVEFEIVAVPPPADVLARLPQPAPADAHVTSMDVEESAEPAAAAGRPLTVAAPAVTRALAAAGLVRDPEGRREALDAFAAAKGATASATRALHKELVTESEERVLVFRDDVGVAFFLALARGGRSPELCLWQLVPAEASLQLVYRWPRGAAARRALGPLHQLLVRLGDQQAAARRAGR